MCSLFHTYTLSILSFSSFFFLFMRNDYFLVCSLCLSICTYVYTAYENRFLYGGPGLWRSASLKGSDPVLLLAQSSFDETINSRSQRTGSLSGSPLFCRTSSMPVYDRLLNYLISKTMIHLRNEGLHNLLASNGAHAALILGINFIYYI